MIRSNVRYVRKRSYKDFNPEDFIDEIARVKWWNVYQSDNVDAVYFQKSSQGF